MSTLWCDFEDARIINNWRKKEMEIAINGSEPMYISRRALCIMITNLKSESNEPAEETFDTEFIPGRGWTPPIEIWRKKGERARKRSVNEIITEYDSHRGCTLKERRKFRHECNKAASQLENFLKICPEEMCPIEYCSDNH